MGDQARHAVRRLVDQPAQIAVAARGILRQAGRGLAALELHEQQQGRLGAGDLLEAAALGDQGLDRELWRQAEPDLAARWQRAGLVVDDRQPAVAADLDPVGARAQAERTAGCRQLDGTPATSAGDPGRVLAPLPLDRGEPGGDPHEARPPDRRDLRLGGETSEMARADPQQL